MIQIWVIYAIAVSKRYNSWIWRLTFVGAKNVKLEGNLPFWAFFEFAPLKLPFLPATFHSQMAKCRHFTQDSAAVIQQSGPHKSHFVFLTKIFATILVRQGRIFKSFK